MINKNKAIFHVLMWFVLLILATILLSPFTPDKFPESLRFAAGLVVFYFAGAALEGGFRE